MTSGASTRNLKFGRETGEFGTAKGTQRLTGAIFPCVTEIGVRVGEDTTSPFHSDNLNDIVRHAPSTIP